MGGINVLVNAMSTAETIYELVKALPEEKANLVLIFTQFVQQQQESFPSPIGRHPRTRTFCRISHRSL